MPADPAAAGCGHGARFVVRGQRKREVLADVWGRDAGRVEERLRTAGSWDERFAVAADVVRRRIGDGPRVDPEVAHIWRRTVAGGGRVRVDGLADEVGWSRKRLWARCRAQLGVTPKRAARLVRFDHAAHLLAAGLPPAGVAAESGYVDQSHLHRDVKAFTGLTPTAVAPAPWLAIDDVAWPDSWRAGRPVTGGAVDGHRTDPVSPNVRRCLDHL